MTAACQGEGDTSGTGRESGGVRLERQSGSTENVASDPVAISDDRPVGPGCLIGQKGTLSTHYHQEQPATDDKGDMSGSYNTGDARRGQQNESPVLPSNHGNGDAGVVYQGEENVREAGHIGSEDDHVDGGEGAVVRNGYRAEHHNTKLRNANEHLDDKEENNRDHAQSVINVEIRSKSMESGPRIVKTANEQGSGGDTPPAARANKAFGVAPDIVSSGNDNFGGIPTKLPNKTKVTGVKDKPSKRKKMKKSIFISYSPDAGFVERKFVVECVRQLKENNLAEDIWFDKDEQILETTCWFSTRLEAAERCRAAILFLSEKYFARSCSFYEAKTLLERYSQDNNAVRIFAVFFSEEDQFIVPQPFLRLTQMSVDVTSKTHIKKSLAEKSSMVVGALMTELEKIASVNAPPAPITPPDTEFNGEYKKKKLCQWGTNDLQEWLFKLGVKEFYRQSLAENMVDGFLLMSMAEQDMVTYLAIDSRVVRRKVTQQVLVTLEKEQKQPDNWHMRARSLRPKPNVLYLVYDPTDFRLGQNLKHDLSKKGLQVSHHVKLGTSKEEFLQQNGPIMAQASHILVIMTDAASNSPFVFHELLFAEWLRRKVIIAQFKNTWRGLRPALRAVIGDNPAVDFETKLYTESMAILEHHIKPIRSVPGVVLEQGYLNKMSEGIKPLFALASQTKAKGTFGDGISVTDNPRIFISYQWDMASKVEEIRKVLEPAGLVCWADIGSSMGSGGPRGNSGLSSRNSGALSSSLGQLGYHLGDLSPESLTTQIQRNMKAAGVVLCCITPKYMQSDNCIKDLTLAENLHKPIIPVMLRFCPWPPEAAPPPVRKVLVRYVPVDLSNDKLYKQNITVLLEKIKRCAGLKQ